MIHPNFVQNLENINKSLFREDIFFDNLNHYRPAMLFGNTKIYFRGSFLFSIVTI